MRFLTTIKQKPARTEQRCRARNPMMNLTTSVAQSAARSPMDWRLEVGAIPMLLGVVAVMVLTVGGNVGERSCQKEACRPDSRGSCFIQMNE